MTAPSPYDILFEPVRIGPVTAPNRFYQVPHCTGLGHMRPEAEAACRAVRAAGGWGVVSTQEAEIHPGSDMTPSVEARLWDERDVPALARMTNMVHAHGALAAVELAHNGSHATNLLTRAPILAPSDTATDLILPRQAAAMDKADIREFRRWHRQAALRAREAGFDIVYVYAGHRMTLLHQFLLPDANRRSDEYGGSIENRVRLVREVLEDTKEAVGDDCAVAFRFAVDEMKGPAGMQAGEEGRAVVELLAEVPDLWDVNVSDWSNDSATTRFQPHDGYQMPYVEFVKQVTSKPVVGTGRLGNPDMMVSLVRRGVLDFIGAARPSIADPYLPAKIADGRIDEIRECIGCNICVSADNLCTGIRCTQNPTMGEEWRRGWHPEIIPPRKTEAETLVVGAGPAGLECAHALARRGYRVTLAEALAQMGGRVLAESSLPGLGAWRRVADHRLGALRQMANVSLYTDSTLDAETVSDLGIANVFIATGARWRLDGTGRTSRDAMTRGAGVAVLGPDDLMAGATPQAGPVLLWDDDQIYLGGVLAEKLAQEGFEVTLATPSALVSPWTANTLEQHRVQKRLLDLGVRLATGRRLANVGAGEVTLACVWTGQEEALPCATIVPVTERTRETALHAALSGTGLAHLALIGDAAEPGLIADAVWSGHRAAQAFEAGPVADAAFFRRELVALT